MNVVSRIFRGGPRLLLLLLALGRFPAAALAETGEPDLRELSIDELMNIPVVSVSKKTEPAVEAPATMMVITAEQIRSRGYEDLEDVLRDLPGFDFVHVQGCWPTIWAQRGAYGDENKRTLLLVDGIVENNLLEGSVLGGPQYSLHMVDRIEVVWGPGSALWGANAFGGVVNIITKKGKDVRGGEYRQSYGANDTRSEKLLVGSSRGDFDFVLSGSLYSTDGPVFEERHPDYTNSYVDRAWSLVGRLDFRGWTLGFSRFDRPMGDGQFSNSPAVEGYGLPPYGWQGREGTNGGGAVTDRNGERGSLWHTVTETAFFKKDFALGSGTQLSAVAYHRRTGIDDDSFEYDFRDGAFHRDVYTHDSSSTGGELKIDRTIGEDHDLTAGVLFERSDVERGYRGTVAIDELSNALLGDDERVSDVYENTAAYGQYRWRTDDLGTSLVAGVRYDHNNVYGGSLNPRLAVVSRLDDETTVKLLYGKAFRAPNSFELFTETNVRIANPGLEPERETCYEMTVTHRPSERLVVDASFFYNDIRNTIVSNQPIGDVDGDGIENTQNQNRGQMIVRGVELRTTADLTSRLRLLANLTIQNGEQDSAGQRDRVPNIAQVKGNLGLGWGDRDLGNVYLSLNVVGDRSTAPTNPRSHVDGYLAANLFVESRPLWKDRLRFGLRVTNLFDADFTDPGIRSASGGYYGTEHVQPGRTALARLDVKF